MDHQYSSNKNADLTDHQYSSNKDAEPPVFKASTGFFFFFPARRGSEKEGNSQGVLEENTSGGDFFPKWKDSKIKSEIKGRCWERWYWKYFFGYFSRGGNGKWQHPLHILSRHPEAPAHPKAAVGGKAFAELKSICFSLWNCNIPTQGSPNLAAKPQRTAQFTKARLVLSPLCASSTSRTRKGKGEKLGFSQTFLYSTQQCQGSVSVNTFISFHEFWSLYSQCRALVTLARETQPWILHRSPSAPFGNI